MLGKNNSFVQHSHKRPFFIDINDDDKESFNVFIKKKKKPKQKQRTKKKINM